MPFGSYRDIIDAYDAGKTFSTIFRKVPAVATAAGIWFDLSMVPGIPGPNYYASSPAVAETLTPTTGSGTAGIQYGGNLPSSAGKKYLARSVIFTSIAPMALILCDYLLYYPFMDMGDTAPQTMDNTKALTRYTDGEGVRIMAVEVAPQIGSATFTVSYTNQDGISDRTTKRCRCNTQTVNGTIINTSATPSVSAFGGPFLNLQEGDTGVRSIESFTMSVADTGLITLVLVKPLATLYTLEALVPAETVWHKDRLTMPEIKNGAFLGLVALSQASLASVTVQGELEFIWN